VSDSVLGGFRVVETAGLVAELAGRWLADLGAEVWKIERPDGAPSRRCGPLLRGDPRTTTFFAYYDAGKRSVVADPASPRDGDRVRELLAAGDVWLDSTAPTDRFPWDLDPASIARTNPRLVVARVTPFGLDGPHAGFRSSDLVAQAAGGMAFTNGYPGETPIPGFGLQGYHAASLHAVIGILLALFERERSGLGQTIDVSLQEAVVASLEQVTAAWNAERRVETRHGSLHWTRVFRTVRCRDGWVLVTLVCDWTALIGWLSERGFGAAFAGDDWQSFLHRREHAEEIFAELERWAEGLDGETIFEGAQLRRIPFAPVRSHERIARDPQLEARGFFAPVAGASIRFPGPPFRMSATPLRTRSAPPRLGGATFPTSPVPRAAVGATNEAVGRRPALDGIGVLDFTQVVAGPIATRILADHGADVMKIERPATLDRGGRRGGFFGNLNRGKRSIVLDLARPEGLAAARHLAARSDVVIDNFSARVMPNLGLDDAGLRALREDLITIRMSGFGESGPWKDYVSFGPTLHALAGHTLLMSQQGRPPAGWGFSHSDVCAGLSAAIAAIAALVHRRRTGRGQAIDLSQFESLVSLMGPTIVEVANGGGAPRPPLARSQETPAAPHGIYRAAGHDRWVAIAVFGDDDWSRFREAVGEAWTDDPRFADHGARAAHAEELDRLIESWTSSRSPEFITERCQSRGVAASTVANGEDLAERDPQLRARGYWAKVRTPEGDVVTLDGVAARLSQTPARVDRPGPLHDEHGFSRGGASSASG
jgi:crotonobetainyl-CoA:carnitine CoA-transferase CaiB-like acyl-CoA transferase